MGPEGAPTDARRMENSMHPFPHTYVAGASGLPAGDVTLSSSRLPDLAAASPPEFDGPGDRWSPETLLCAAVANCFVLTFRAYARAAKLEWNALECRTEGVLENAGGVSQFTRFTTRAKLSVPAGTDEAKARSLLQKAEDRCLITNSLKAERHLEAEVVRTG
jgi:organic hydroperoxide reductase OsmC/OhrA